jgi:Ran GTPase-activating protein (RanGAP) involved in mRNA processing and transport
MTKIDKVKELIIKEVKSLSEMYEDSVFDLTEFNETVNKIDDLDKLDDYVTDYLYSEEILEKEYEVADFWKYIYREVAGLN